MGNGIGQHEPELRPIFFRSQAQDKLREIQTYINDQRGNDPNDDTSRKVIATILKGLQFIRAWPWSGQQIRHASINYRKRQIGNSYIAYYFVRNPDQAIFIIDIRHSSQRPLKASTLRKYKNEINPQ